MGKPVFRTVVLELGLSIAAASRGAPIFNFSTGDPNGLMAWASRPDSGGEIESADD